MLLRNRLLIIALSCEEQIASNDKDVPSRVASAASHLTAVNLGLISTVEPLPKGFVTVFQRRVHKRGGKPMDDAELHERGVERLSLWVQSMADRKKKECSSRGI